MKINVKLFLGFLIGSLMLIFILAFIFYNDLFNILTKQSLTERKQEMSLRKDSIEYLLRDLESETIFLSDLTSIRNYISTSDPQIKQSEQKELDRLFKIYLKEHEIYNQITILNEFGQEILNINRDENNKPFSTPPNQLKNKKDSYFFVNTKDLNKEEIFLSLAVSEQKETDTSANLILSHSTPIFDKNGQKKGTLIIDSLVDFILAGSKIDANEIILANNDGYYLRHTDKNKEWDFVNKDGKNIYTDYPAIEVIVQNEKSGQFFDENDKSYLIFYRINPYSNRVKKIHMGVYGTTSDQTENFIYEVNESIFWTQALSIKQSEILDRVNILFFKTLSLILLILMFFVVSMMAFLQRIVIEPVGKIIQGADRIKKGNLDYKLSLGSRKDEFGDLANEFNSMSAVLKRYKETMEQKIYERTADLEKFKNSIENAQECIIITDPEGVILYANNSVERITGYSKNEVVNQKAGTNKLWGGIMANDFYQKLWQTIKIEKKPFLGKIKNKRKNNEEYTSLLSITPMLDHDGNIIHFFGIENDLSDIDGQK